MPKPRAFSSEMGLNIGGGRYCYATTNEDEAVPGSIGRARLWANGVRSSVIVHFCRASGPIPLADQAELEAQLFPRMVQCGVDFRNFPPGSSFTVDLHVTPELVGRYA
jgi:hypothetical protein